MVFELWMVTAAANVIMVIVYASIAFIMISSIVRGRQLLSNPVLTATAAIFVTCTIGHGTHMVHVFEPYVAAQLGFDAHAGEAARVTFSDWRLVVWDVITAVVAVWYFTLRNRFAIIYQGASLCEDMAKRQAQANELHGVVVKGLQEAKLAIDAGQSTQGQLALEKTLTDARKIITHLLGAKETPTELGPGDLRRTQPAGHR